MIQRIGGEFEISPIDFLRPNVEKIESYSKENVLYVDTGRSAIYISLHEILRRGGKKVAWLPVFCCESIIQPFEQLGFSIYYYSVGDDLQTPDYLPEKLDGETFLFINYFGKKNKAIIRFLEQLSQKERSFFVIEDNVQAAFSQNVGYYGDFIIYSYRKFLPQPDGAALAYDGDPISFDIKPVDESFVSEKLIAKIMRASNGNENEFLSLLSHSEERIKGLIEPRRMSRLSKFLFGKVDEKWVMQKRRENWQSLFYGLKREGLFDFITPLYDSLEDQEVPLGLPVIIEHKNRDSLRHFLMSHHIFCPIHWPISTKYSLLFPRDFSLSKSILTLPIDQRVTSEGIEYFIEKLKLFYMR